MIHPTAIIEPGAVLGENVKVGAYTIIRENVTIGAGTVIGPHVVIEGQTTIGCDNEIFQFASIGAIPQDLKFHGEVTKLIIGDRNKIREFNKGVINRAESELSASQLSSIQEQCPKLMELVHSHRASLFNAVGNLK